MTVRNPSEMQRLTEELEELFLEITDHTKFYPRAKREELLRQIRVIERQLGMEGTNYNSSEFGKEYRK